MFERKAARGFQSYYCNDCNVSENPTGVMLQVGGLLRSKSGSRKAFSPTKDGEYFCDAG